MIITLVPTLQPADESFFDSAPNRFTHTWSIDRPAPSVWAELVGERPLHWCRGLEVTWTSPRPFGVGTTRQAKVFRGVLAMHERYFLWEEGRRQAFAAERGNAPLFRRFAEDYRVDPDGPDRCQLTWTIALEPTLLGKAGAPVNGLLFHQFFADTGRHFNAS